MIAQKEKSNVLFDESDLIQSICRDSYYEFLKEFWHEIIPEDPVLNWHVKYLCDEFQKLVTPIFLMQPREADAVINVPPGTTKSTIFSVMSTGWCWTRMPSLRHIGASHTADLSLDLGGKARRIVNSEKYQAAFNLPNEKYNIKANSVVPMKDQNVKSNFQNASGGARYSVGAGGSVIGKHAHLITIDDPIDPQGALSEAAIKQTNEWIEETLSQRKVDKDVTLTILVMQRLHQIDPSGERLKKSKMLPVKHICLPAEKSPKINPPHLRRKYSGGLLDPKRLNQKVLDEALLTLGQYGKSCQYDQSPIPRGGGMFKTHKLHLVPAAPVAAYFEKIVRFWDKAGTQDGGAFTAGIKMGIHKDGSFWVFNVRKGQWAADEREEAIKQTAIADGHGVEIGVEQEGGSGGKESAESTVKRLAGFIAYARSPEGDKVWRADTFSGQVNVGNVYLVDGDWVNDYIQEMQYFPLSQYKDQIDASSGAFKELTMPKLVAGGL
jgi:predicted phage terminase large subunit-like protein